MHYTQNLIGPERLSKLVPTQATLKARQELLKQLENGDLPMLRPSIVPEDFSRWQSVAAQWKQRFSDVVVLGTGGSSLGAQALVALKQGHAWQKKGCPRLHFLDNLDAATFSHLLASLDIENTGFLVVSKSGTTAETLCQFLLVLQQLEGSLEVTEQVMVVTQTQSDSPLLKLSEKLNLNVLAHPEDIGGRFSVLTVVGLLPALMAGVDIAKVVEGAQDTCNSFMSDTSHSAVLGAQMHDQFAQAGCHNAVLLPYADQLYPLALWFRQLWAESLGKQGKGTTPIQALGPVDQHSQLQLYLDGPKDKFFTVLVSKDQQDTEAIDPQITSWLGLDYLTGKTMGQLCFAEYRATVDTLVDVGCPVRNMEFTLDEKTLGSLMMHFFIETILVSHLWHVNPFDQPAVEASKRLTKKYLIEGN